MNHPQRTLAITFLLISNWAFASARAQVVGPGDVVVHTALGGFILGYDIDRNGTEGVLCEARTLPNGHHDVAVETFDQNTGAIIKIVRRINDTNHDFVTLGIAGGSVGLIEFEHVGNLFVDDRSYLKIDPLTANAFTGTWTPPLTVADIILSMSRAQGPITAFMSFHNGGNSDTNVFASNVKANTFGPLITVIDPVFTFSNSPVMALDRVRNQAVLAASNGCPLCHPTLGFVDLASGVQSSMAGLGFGYVNGIAIDSSTGVACTATEIDFSLQFYDLVTHSGFLVHIPGATSQAQSGQDVQLDPYHQLFLVGQQFSSVAPSGSSILVFDEQGNFIESVDGLDLPASPALLALNPRLRLGFVRIASDQTALQLFHY